MWKVGAQWWCVHDWASVCGKLTSDSKFIQLFFGYFSSSSYFKVFLRCSQHYHIGDHRGRHFWKQDEYLKPARKLHVIVALLHGNSTQPNGSRPLLFETTLDYLGEKMTPRSSFWCSQHVTNTNTTCILGTLVSAEWRGTCSWRRPLAFWASNK